MNFVFISANFPKIYSHFVKALNDKGVTVLAIGDEPYDNLVDELKNNVQEYCYVSNLSNIEWMKNTLDYLENKYGQIDYIESNNEFWLFNDSIYREYKHVPNGFYPSDMEKIKYKSKMKEYFSKAGVKTARYVLANDIEEVKRFATIVGYPLFVKPDNGVGASHSHKIKDESDLEFFFKTKDNTTYIVEEYINGTIITFDGICDDESNPLLIFNEVFPIPVADVVNDNLDDFYYASTKMDESFKEMGVNTVKSFGIKKRCFHIEFFKLNEDKEGLAKKGEIIGLEVNMRPPGGDTPDLLSIAMNGNFYEEYANIIVDNKINKEYLFDDIAISVSRKNRYKYVSTVDEILNKYKDNIIRHGYYDKAIADCMGDEFYFAKFNDVKDALSFKDFVMAKTN